MVQRDGLWITATIVACLVLTAVLLMYVDRDHQRWIDWCYSEGGHVVETSLDYICLTPDGRILGAR